MRRERKSGKLLTEKLKYKKKLVKTGKEVIEHPKKVVVAEYFFEEDASRMVKFQNENQVFKGDGGIPEMLHIKLGQDPDHSLE
jgi:aromatic ring-opening dioxygenase catalytic subunit (LigB family)